MARSYARTGSIKRTAEELYCHRNTVVNRLHALHLNDSKNPFASHKDRHECLGKGSLGLEAFRRIVNHPYLKDKPMILETPNELPGYAEEIRILREMEA